MLEALELVRYSYLFYLVVFDYWHMLYVIHFKLSRTLIFHFDITRIYVKEYSFLVEVHLPFHLVRSDTIRKIYTIIPTYDIAKKKMYDFK